MSFKVTGKISKVLAKEEGTSKAGKEWVKQSFVVVNNDGYEGKEVIYCFEIFGGEKVDKFNQYNKVGDVVEVSFSIGTNEWKEKYFTSLSAFSVFKSEVSATLTPEFDTVDSSDLKEVDDDLPF
jgi:hypothetical protein